MQVNAYLMFDGTCDAAFKFYEKCFDAKTVFRMTYGESPAAGQTPPELHNAVLHARLEFDGNVLMGADACDRYQRPQGFMIALNLTDADKAERIFQGLSDHGTVSMPLEETFWAKRFGMVTDQFGIPWMINCGAPAT